MLIPLSVLFSAMLFAGEKVDDSLSVDGINVASIDIPRGDVIIIGTSGNILSVVGELDEKMDKFIFEKSGSEIQLEVKMPRHQNSHWDNDGSKLTIKVPNSIKVNFEGISTNVDVENLTKGTEIQTISGDIKATKLTDHIELNSISGDITSSSLNGKITLSTVSGNIVDKSSAGRLQLKAISGDIDTTSAANEVSISQVSGEVEFTLSKVDDLKIKSVSGDVDGKVELSDDGRIKMSGVSADLSLALQKGVDANFKFSATAGGSIKNSLTNDKAQRAKYGPSSKLNFSTGNGGASVKASVVSGKIKISEY